VQGVFFRDSARGEALKLGLSGCARNLPDGRVEVVVCGEEEAVEQLCQWLWEGSPAARVKDVRCEPAEDEGSVGFEVR